MTPQERRSALSLAVIFALRMLGLFMILPVFALYAEGLADVTPMLVGIAIGIYGLTQALLQIPFGMASDRLGRKPVIAAGLLIFAVGSAVAALADGIWGVIIGRALQGSGAVAAAVMALAADLTREEHRTKAMAVIGTSIGISFVAAMVLGPVLDELIGVAGLFWLIAIMALLGIAVLYLLVPTPRVSRQHRDAEAVPAQMGSMLRNGQLLRLDFGIFVLHLCLTASFVVLPLMLRDTGFAPRDHWMLYLPVMVLALAAMVPFIIVAEKRRRMKPILLGAIATLLLATAGFAAAPITLASLAGLMWVFFTAFNLLEASLPSLVSKTAPADAKGTAMGVYSSSQFLGAFAGGALGGWLHQFYGEQMVFVICSALVFAWLLGAATMRPPVYLTTTLLRIGAVANPEEARRLQREIASVEGVAEVVVSPEEGIAYLKVDKRRLDEAALRAFTVHGD